MRQYGVAVLVDDLSLGFLGDAQLDYVEELVGSYFKVEIPTLPLLADAGPLFLYELGVICALPGMLIH